MLGFYAELVFACFSGSALLTGAVYLWLSRHGVLDYPNARSSHVTPTPRGGGLAVIPVVAAGWTLLAALGLVPAGVFAIIPLGLTLAALSWRDDRQALPVATRLGVHLLVVALALPFLPRVVPVFQGLLPGWADTAAAGLLWLWFLNAFNFMDGIDGIAAMEAASVGLGLAFLALVGLDQNDGLAPLGVTIAAAAAGFLVWNWPPARLFLGDVGSIPLGFFLGYLLLSLAGRGYWAPALILPLYFLADAGLTLGRRALRGARIWEAHREHLYQRVVQAGRSHGWVVRRILLGNLALVSTALVALRYPWLGAILSVAAMAVLFHRLRQRLPVPTA